MSELVTGYVLAVNVPYAVAIAFVVAEVSWLARARSTRRKVLQCTATAAAMGAVAFVIGVVYTAVFKHLWLLYEDHHVDALAAFWRAHPLIGAVAAFVAWDAVGWLYHAVGHRTRIGWAAHQPHHTGEAYDATLGFRQTWVPFHGLVYQPALAFAGFDLRVVVVCAAVSNCWQVLEHTSFPVRLPRWLAASVMTPDAHRLHHARGAGAVNLGPVFTWWDRLVGTWCDPSTVPVPVAYGIDERPPANPLVIEWRGWRDLIEHYRSRLRGRASGRRTRQRPSPGAQPQPVLCKTR